MLPSFGVLLKNLEPAKEEQAVNNSYSFFEPTCHASTSYQAPSEAAQWYGGGRGVARFKWGQESNALFLDDLPSSEARALSCCNREFDSEDQLQRHRAEHVQCSVNGCPFSAHSSLVESHFKNQHETGLYNKIWKTETKEDIDKWISERSGNFPTRLRRETKKAEVEAKRARGEVLDTRQFGRMHQGHSNEGFQRGRGRGRGDFRGRGRGDFRGRGRGDFRGRGRGDFRGRGRGRGSYRGGHDNDGIQGEGSGPWMRRQPRMTGLAYHRPEDDPLSSILTNRDLRQLDIAMEMGDVRHEQPMREPEESVTVVAESVNPEPVGNSLGALGNLCSAYDSDEDEEDDTTTNETVSKGVSEVLPSGPATSSSQAKVEDEEEDRPPPSSGRTNSHVDFSCDPVRKLQEVRQRCLSNPKQALKRPKLIEMLLAREIRHERNLLLQCVRYVCQENFFDVASE